MAGPILFTNPTVPRELPTVHRSMEPQIFHRRLPEYEVTPLVRLKSLAGRLGLGELLVKDESDRLGMSSFKILGASWAVYTLLSRKLGLAMGSWEGLEELYALLEPLRPLELVTASEGNHGLAVAAMAERLGLWSKVFVPDGIAPFRVDAIRAHGAEIVPVDGGYDDAVAAAAGCAESDAGSLLVQDTGRDLHEEVPSWIVDGYDTLFQEVDEQMLELGVRRPDLVLVQIGVGSLAMAAIRHYFAPGAGSLPRMLGVEPVTAAAAIASLKAGRPEQVPVLHRSVMAGLNCGLLSSPAWPWIRGGLDGIVALEDDRVGQAVEEFRAHSIDAGESGAAGFAGLLEICSNPSIQFVRERARLSTSSVVLVINTEGGSRGGG
jgi:diaminopropionate ammonia-lyase